MEKQELRDKVNTLIVALSVLQKYPLSPATLIFIISIMVDDEEFWGYLFDAIQKVMKVDKPELLEQTQAVSVYMKENMMELVKEVKDLLLREDINGNGS